MRRLSFCVDINSISFLRVRFVADVRWGDVNLTEVNWELLKEVGEEQKARWQKKHNGTTRNWEEQLNEYHRAARTNRQLAGVLQGHGLNDDAARFAYRAQ